MMPRATSCITDLPSPAVQLITQLARGKIILGTNRFACVCRQWRDADSSSEGSEPLQLFADLRHMSGPDVTRAFSWMATHGQQVQGLVLRECFTPPLAALLSRAAPSLCNLTWLEVFQRHSLVLLAPVLDKLPQLKHLGAQVELGTTWVSERAMFLPMSGPGPWEEVPDMQQLCPQLTSLHLRLDVESHIIRRMVDERLSQLLPRSLQRFELVTTDDCHARLQPHSLMHVTGLQQLTLDGVVLMAEGADMLVQRLGLLQRLELWEDESAIDEEGLMLQLAPKVTGYWKFIRGGAVEFTSFIRVRPMVHLRTLMLGWEGRSLPEGIATTLAALTALQRLSLEGGGFGVGLAGVLMQVGSMSALRSLRLKGYAEYLRSDSSTSAFSSGLAQCVQLTALTLLVAVQAGFSVKREFVPVPQQLAGLRRLVVPASEVGHEASMWLAPFTHLTCLGVQVPGAQPTDFVVLQGPVSQLQAWPAALQQVLYAVGSTRSGLESFKPAWCPTTPGAPRDALHVSVWVEGQGWEADGRVQPLRPCPHLPNVWEVQGCEHGQGQGSCWSWSRIVVMNDRL